MIKIVDIHQIFRILAQLVYPKEINLLDLRDVVGISVKDVVKEITN